MVDFRGYPVPPCPECGDNATVEIVRPTNPERQFGPGEWALLRCSWCAVQWSGIIPEPPNRYEGDGVFAANH